MVELEVHVEQDHDGELDGRKENQQGYLGQPQIVVYPGGGPDQDEFDDGDGEKDRRNRRILLDSGVANIVFSFVGRGQLKVLLGVS